MIAALLLTATIQSHSASPAPIVEGVGVEPSRLVRELRSFPAEVRPSPAQTGVVVAPVSDLRDPFVGAIAHVTAVPVSPMVRVDGLRDPFARDRALLESHSWRPASSELRDPFAAN